MKHINESDIRISVMGDGERFIVGFEGVPATFTISRDATFQLVLLSDGSSDFPLYAAKLYADKAEEHLANFQAKLTKDSRTHLVKMLRERVESMFTVSQTIVLA